MPSPSGVTTLVLLPGMDGSGALFSRFVRALGPQVEARVLHYPPEGPLGYAELASTVRAALPVDRPYVLLAESFSGPVGIALAADAPGLCRGLVLCCSFGRNPRPGLAMLRPLLPLASRLRAPVGPLGRLLMGRWFEPALQAELAAAVRTLPPLVLGARLRAVLDVDMTERLRAVRCPVLYLRAHQDRVVPRSAGEEVLRVVPQAEIADLQGPHFLLQTRPAEAAAAIHRFLGRL